jgi:hypothetical protein
MTPVLNKLVTLSERKDANKLKHLMLMMVLRYGVQNELKIKSYSTTSENIIKTPPRVLFLLVSEQL